MNGTQDTCADRIAAQLALREQYARALFSHIDTDLGADEEVQEELDSWPLALSRKVVFRLELSTGGPADWLEIVTEPARYSYDIERVVYHFADWFDHAELDVSTDSPMYRVAEYFIEGQSPEQDR